MGLQKKTTTLLLPDWLEYSIPPLHDIKTKTYFFPLKIQQKPPQLYQLYEYQLYCTA